MSRDYMNVLIVTTICLSLYNGLGSAMKIDINPSKAHRLVHHEVDIYCKLEKSDSDIKEVIILELAKGDKPIAILRQNTHLTTGPGMKSKYQAEGRILTSPLDSYLHVTLSNPDIDDSGPYTCLFYFKGDMTLVKESRRSDNLTVYGSALNFDITPDKVNRLVQRDVTIHCNMEYSGKDVTQITSLEVTRDGDTIAVIDEDSQINIGDGMESKFKAEGKLSAPPMKSYLHLTLSNPDAKDSGRYTCLVYYVDEMSRTKESSKSDNLTVVDHDVKATFRFLVDSLSGLKTEHKEDIEETTKGLDSVRNRSMNNQDRISTLKTQLNHQISVQESDVDLLKKELDTQANSSATNQNLTSTLKTELSVLERTHKTDVDKINTELDKQTEESESSDVLVSSLKSKLTEQIKAHERDVQVLKKELDRQRNESRAIALMTSDVKKGLNFQKGDHSEDVLYFKDMLHKEVDRYAGIEEGLASLKPTIDEQTGPLKTKIDRIEKKINRQKNVLKEKTSKLDTDIKQTAHGIEAQDKTLKEHGEVLKKLNATEQTLRDSLLLHQQYTSTQSDRIDDVMEKKKRTVLFKALHNGELEIKMNQNMVYSDVIQNEGGGYNGDTGIFTAPFAGYYILTLSFATNFTKWGVYLDLQTSKNEVLTTLFAGEARGWPEYSDTSVMTKLATGEQVRPVIRDFNIDGYPGLELSHRMLNKFTGYLLDSE